MQIDDLEIYMTVFIYYFGTRFSSLTLIMAIDAPFEKTALVIMSRFTIAYMLV